MTQQAGYDQRHKISDATVIPVLAISQKQNA
jgi:hypothetical protein